jgi:hypothetical protein
MKGLKRAEEKHSYSFWVGRRKAEEMKVAAGPARSPSVLQLVFDRPKKPSVFLQLFSSPSLLHVKGLGNRQ